jgi:hypothetical protein
MQAYQSAPCPYCGITWNQPGAQTCANCRNQLPPPQASYTPPGYSPAPQSAPPAAPGQPQGYPYAAPNYPQQGYSQGPASPYPGAPAGYPGQPDPGQPPQDPTYVPPGYPPTQGYPQQPGGYGQGYPTYAPAAAPAAGTTLRLFGQSIAIPVALPPAVVQYQKQIVYGAVGVLALLIVLFGITPALASGQISGANQALTVAASHQARVDAVFVQFLGAQSNTNDPNAMKAQFDKLATSFNDGLALVQSDEAALNSSNQRLTYLQWVTPSRGAAISSERQRLDAALAGLKQADTALTAAVNEAKVIQPYIDALIDFTKMGAALGKHDLVGAGALYPDAQSKVQTAISLAGAPGLPPQIAKQLNSFNDLLTDTESLIQAIQSKNAADIKKYTDLGNAALKAMSSAAETLPPDYETKTFGPMQKAYDGAMKAIASSSR